jgi:hypothetical protein
MSDKEALSIVNTMKLALEALENPWKAGPDGVADAITAIKEALAQPEQEQGPIGFYSGRLNGHDLLSLVIQIPVGTNLYTTPPQRTWVGLTDEEIVQCQQGDIYHFYRCIEAKLKEKNSA